MQTAEQLLNDEIKRLSHELDQLRKNYDTLFKASPIAYLILDNAFRINRFNDMAARLFETADLNDKNLTQYMTTDTRDELYFYIMELKKGIPLAPYTLDFRISGHVKHCRLYIQPVENGTGDLVRCAIIDETKDILYHQEIEELSYRDALTGLFNRRYFDKFLASLRDEGAFPIAFIIADLNGMKLVNDAFGHAQGDQMLQQAATTLSSVLTKVPAMIARLGGDEFGILVPGLEGAALTKLVQRLEQATRALTVGYLSLSVSFGCSVLSNREQDSTVILAEAEKKMFRNKLNTSGNQRHILVTSLLASLHERLPGEAKHSERVGQNMKAFGEALNFDKLKCLRLQTAGLMHDIGKISLDHCVIVKSSALNKSDWEELQKHPEIGFRILSSTTTFSDIAEIVLTHHERLDGKGYPRQLTGEFISEEARMIAICEAYDAMTNVRSYRKAISRDAAIAALEKNAGTQFDPRLVQIFIDQVLKVKK